MRGDGEFFRAIQSSGAFTSSRAQVGTCRSANLPSQTQAHSFFAGTPSSGVLVNLWAGLDGVTLQMNPSDPATKEVQLAPFGDAMCYFTYIGGKFDGFGEEVRIYPKIGSDGVDHWFLRVSSGASNGRKFVKASANCMMRRQFS